jgi:DNA-binding transcriptional regulator YhcF (GntR family)
MHMQPLITIDKKLHTPAFRQIVNAIEDSIRTGAMKPGDKLPPERELAASLEVARGTVTRAYAELARRGLMEPVQGRGSIVTGQAGPEAGGRKEKAQALIGQLVDSLASLRFGFPEMRAMIDMAVIEREEALAGLAVAAVDCNPETLGMFERQIGILSRVSVTKFLLDEITKDRDPRARLAGFDLLLTTTTHHADLRGLAPDLAERMVPVSVAPSQETVLRLASLKPDQRIGVLCQSVKFFSIVQLRLGDMHFTGSLEALYAPRAPGALAGFLADREVLIVAPGERPSREEARAVEAFTGRGGLMVTFDYQIERGSLTHVEERIHRLLEARSGGTGR